MKYRIRKQDELKPSGVEWLGDIYKNWGVNRLKYCFTYKKGKNPAITFEEDSTNELLPYLSTEYLRKGTNIQYVDNKNNDYLIANVCDILLLWDGANAGEFFISKKGIVSSTMALLKQINQNDIDLFLKYFLKNIEKYLRSSTTGMGIPHINSQILNNLIFLLPPINEQQKIANFLDEKSKIFDDSISKKEKLISKLELAKQSLISEVVTGKLKIIETNSKLQTIKREQNELKQSGVECLGDIPKDWEVKKLKYIIKLNPNKFNLDEKIKNDIEVSFVPMENVRRGNINLDNNKNINSVITGYTFFEDNDIVIAKVTPCFENHNCAIAENLKNKIGFGSTELNVLRCFNKDSIKFVYYYIQTDLFINLGVSQMTGTGGLKRVPSSFFENFKISFPTITEQKQISKYLDEKLIHFDNTIEKTKQSIKKLKLAKEALISQAVTGKIEVL